jgi:PAS domain S-box-containing protein
MNPNTKPSTLMRKLEEKEAELDRVLTELASERARHRQTKRLLRENSEHKQIERAIEENQERYRFLFTQSRDGITLISLDHVIIEANQHLADMLGYEIDDLIGVCVYDFFLPEEKSQAFKRAEKVSRGQVLPITERRIKRKDGSIFIGEANLSLVKGSDGQPLYLLGIVRDITERKQLEETLKEREAQLRQIGDNLPKGMVYRLVHTQDGHRSVSYISKGFERLYGVTVEEVMQDINILYGMMLPEDLKAVILAEEESVKNLDRFDWEGRFRLRSGEIRWSRYHSKPSVLPDGTRIWDGIALDITEQKQAEKLLRESEATSRALLNASIDIAMLTKPDGSIVALNQAAANTMGGMTETLIGQNVLDFFPADLSQARRARAEEVAKSGTPVQFEDNREGMRFRNQIYPIFDEDGQVSQLAIYAHDITDVQDRAVAEERVRIARELHDSVTQTMYSVSIVAEALPRLLDRDPGEARRRAVHLRQMTLGALAEMRNLLFEFHPKALRDTKLCILVQQLCDVLTGRIRIPVDITIEGDAQIPEEVKIAFYRVTQESFNNIAKHAYATQVNAVLQSGPNECRLTIHDNGRGFDLDAVNSEKLGLKIMRERVEEIGGDLRVESTPNHGTHITLFWSG